jgi:hypothetical protein
MGISRVFRIVNAVLEIAVRFPDPLGRLGAAPSHEAKLSPDNKFIAIIGACSFNV